MPFGIVDAMLLNYFTMLLVTMLSIAAALPSSIRNPEVCTRASCLSSAAFTQGTGHAVERRVQSIHDRQDFSDNTFINLNGDGNEVNIDNGGVGQPPATSTATVTSTIVSTITPTALPVFQTAQRHTITTFVLPSV